MNAAEVFPRTSFLHTATIMQRTYRWLLLSLAVIGLTLDLGSKYGVFRALYKSEFKLTDKSLISLSAVGLPDSVIEKYGIPDSVIVKLKPLQDKEFESREAFLKALSERSTQMN